MGIFDFVREAGESLGSKIHELTNDEVDINSPVPPERLNKLRKMGIERTVAEMDLGIDNFNVDVDGELVKITGTASSQEAAEKATLACGNQQGVSQVDCQLTVLEVNTESVAQESVAPGATELADEAQFYTVKSGDTLSKIAKEFLGNANSYMKIFEANKPMLQDPDKIYVGQTLRIPKS